MSRFDFVGDISRVHDHSLMEHLRGHGERDSFTVCLDGPFRRLDRAEGYREIDCFNCHTAVTVSEVADRRSGLLVTRRCAVSMID